MTVQWSSRQETKLITLLKRVYMQVNENQAIA